MWGFQWDDLCRVKIWGESLGYSLSEFCGCRKLLWICSHANKGSSYGQAANEGQEGEVEKC